MGNDFKDVIKHRIQAFLVVVVWIATTWFTHGFLLPHLPISGMSMYTFWVAEFLMEAGMLWHIFRWMFLPNAPAQAKRWEPQVRSWIGNVQGLARKIQSRFGVSKIESGKLGR